LPENAKAYLAGHSCDAIEAKVQIRTNKIPT